MKASEFCYWLQGFFELRDESYAGLNQEQVAMIKRHLAMVFIHDIDPKAGPQSVQQQLQAVHDAGKMIGGKGPNGEVYRC